MFSSLARHRLLPMGAGILLSVFGLTWALQQDVRSPGFLRAQTAGAGDVENWNAIDDMKFGTDPLNAINAVAYGNGKFVAVGNDGKGSYSADGITWTAIGNTGFPAGYSIRSIAYGAGKFVAVGDGGKGSYSTDGITWIPISNMQFNSYWGNGINAVAYGNGKFVAVGEQSVAYSADGITWTAGTIDAYGRDLYYLAYGAGKFLSVNGAVMGYYSVDGITWNQSDYMKLDGQYLSTYTYGIDKFVALGGGQGAYSTDGITWITMSSAPDVQLLRALTYGNGKFVLVRGGGTGAYSADGITWTPINDTKIDLPLAIACGAGKCVAVGRHGKGSYSGPGPAPASSLSSSSQQSVNCSPCTTGGGCQTCAANARLCAIWNDTGDDECLVSPLAGYTVCSCSAASRSSSSSSASLASSSSAPSADNNYLTTLEVIPYMGGTDNQTQFFRVLVTALNNGDTDASVRSTVVTSPATILNLDNTGIWKTDAHCAKQNADAATQYRCDYLDSGSQWILLPPGGTHTFQYVFSTFTPAPFTLTATTGPVIGAQGQSQQWSWQGVSSSSSSSSSVASSVTPDTMSWTAIGDMKFGEDTIYSIACAEGTFVAVGDSSAYNKGKGSYSDYMFRWQTIDDRSFGFVGGYIHAVTYGAGMFIAGDYLGKGYLSLSNGMGWQRIYDMKMGGSKIFTLAYGADKFVAAGSNGKGSYSIGGSAWTAISDMQMGNVNINSMIYGNGKFVAVGDNGKGSFSTDGSTWTAISDMKMGDAPIRSVAYGNGRFVAVSGGKGAYSQDGVTWTAIDHIKAAGLRSIVYGADRFVAVGSHSKGAYSTDGVTWTAINDVKLGSWGANSLAYCDGKFVAVGDNGRGSYSELLNVPSSSSSSSSFSSSSLSSSSADSLSSSSAGGVSTSASSEASVSSGGAADSSSSIMSVVSGASCPNGILDGDETCEIGVCCPSGQMCDQTCHCVPETGGLSSSSSSVAQEQSSSSTGIQFFSSSTSSSTSSVSSFFSTFSASSSSSSSFSSASSASSSSSLVCGNGMMEGSEQCEVGIACANGNTCNNCSCITVGFCGDGIVHPQRGEECEQSGDCPSGSVCSMLCQCIETQGNCGNGALEGSEQCESGRSCAVGKICNNCLCSDVPVCGNQAVEYLEECERDNHCGRDQACVNCICRGVSVCGNGTLETNEQCESTAHCLHGQICNRNSCRCEGEAQEYCGDAVLNDGEECEMNAPCAEEEQNCDLRTCQCSKQIAAVSCGDAILDSGEDCDIGAPCPDGMLCSFSNCHCTSVVNRCGDGRLAGSEQCEIGDRCETAEEVCDIASCQCASPDPSGRCGNGSITPGENCEVGVPCPFGWSCDFPRCLCMNQPVCGNGLLDPGELCEINTACAGDQQVCDFSRCRCMSRVYECGNGARDPGEECDDGNTVSDDGCSRSCKRESLYSVVGAGSLCGNGIVEQGEQCDDGNLFSNDGCSAFCLFDRNAAISAPTAAPVNNRMEVAPGVSADRFAASERLPSLQADAYVGPQPIPFTAQSSSIASRAGASPLAAVTIPFPTFALGTTRQSEQANVVPTVLPYGVTQVPITPTGPETVALISAGAALGFAWIRRRRRG